jgi:hypothetical protein
MSLTFSAGESNDLYRLIAEEGIDAVRFDDPASAIRHAPPGSAVLLLSVSGPDRPLSIEAGLWEEAGSKNLRLYVETPASLPGLTFGPLAKTVWERGIVVTDLFAPALPAMSLVQIHDCRYYPAEKVAESWLSIAKVAGYDHAVFGVPDNASPLLFPYDDRTLVATTNLSHFVTGRYAPQRSWKLFWEALLLRLTGEKIDLKWIPRVHPACAKDAPLPPRAETDAVKRYAEWNRKSRLLVRATEADAIHRMIASGAETRSTPPDDSDGDGSCGILEGFASAIQSDGGQLQRIPLRADCQAETAMALAVHGASAGDEESLSGAWRLLDYLYFDSGMCGGVRGDPGHPAYGMIAWGGYVRAWEIANYGDDNARAILATILAARRLKSDRWDEPVLKAILANFRTTGRFGFRGDRIDLPELEKNGWRYYFEREIVNPAPHFESYLWACYLWAYRRTGFEPFLKRSKEGIRRTMEVFPRGWRWGNNPESARMILCLAWLLRAEDAEENRKWLRAVLDDLLETQAPCGALRERLRGVQTGHYSVPESNEDYGVKETPLIQEDGDPASDQLYSTGFALLGLREANAVLSDQSYRDAEDRLADYLCRIQVRSEARPELDGAWYRAFDYERWDYWSSSADMGWGAWSAEAGWGAAWTAAALDLRNGKTTFWEETAQSSVAAHWESSLKEMDPDGLLKT